MNLEFTDDELEHADELLALAAKEWNEKADELNQWYDLSILEKVTLVLRRLNK